MATPLITQTAQQLTAQANALHALAFSPGVDPDVQSESLEAASDCSDRAATLFGIQLDADTQAMQASVNKITAAKNNLATLLQNITNVSDLINTFANYLKAVDAFITVAKLAAAA
jgi:hypothetical protein